MGSHFHHDSTPRNMPQYPASMSQGSAGREESDERSMSASNEDGAAGGPGGGPGSARRAKTGCITCRLRKKRCDEGKPKCAACSRLGIECLGYGAKRPQWLRVEDNAKKTKQEIKDQLSSRRKRSRAEAESEDGQSVERDLDSSEEPMASTYPSNSMAESTSHDTGPLSAQETSMPAHHQQGHPYDPVSRSSQTHHRQTLPWEISSTDEPWSSLSHSSTALAGCASTSSNAYPTGSRPSYAPSTDPIRTDTSYDFSTALIPSPQPFMTNEQALEDVWSILFGSSAPTSNAVGDHDNNNVNVTGSRGTAPDINPFAMSSSLTMSYPNFGSFPLNPALGVLDSSPQGGGPSPPLSIPSLTSFFAPSPTNYVPSPPDLPSVANSGSSFDSKHPTSQQMYLHHYLNVVLPLQYTLGGLSMSDFVAPLALTRPDVLTSVASLAALHLVAARRKIPISRFRMALLDETCLSDADEDVDAKVATSSHRQTVERLRFVSPEELTKENVIVSALFAISYDLFSGEAAGQWVELLQVIRRCLGAALAASPELQEGCDPSSPSPGLTPWSRYPQLISCLVWTDIFGTVTEGKASRYLHIYKNVLGRSPAYMAGVPRMRMDEIMGCDSTTMLALAETVALGDWKSRCLAAGCLSVPELVRRSSLILKLLDERTWREAHLDDDINAISESSNDKEVRRAEKARRGELMRKRAMAEVFACGARVLLHTVVNGNYPRVPEIAQAVQDTQSALTSLSLLPAFRPSTYRSLVLPITLAGCHCETAAQQAFFRERFSGLGDEAAAFGNTRPALELMEEVWKRRRKASGKKERSPTVTTKRVPTTSKDAAGEGSGGRGRGAKIGENTSGGGEGAAGVQPVCWREVMKDIGWEAGLLLI